MFSRKMRSITIVALALIMAVAVSLCVVNLKKPEANAEQNTSNEVLNSQTEQEQAVLFSVTVTNGDQTTTVDSQTEELVYTLPTENVIDGYTFLGWFVGNEFVDKTQTHVTLTKDISTITALYAKINFIGGGIRTEGTTGVRFKFELELYKINDPAIMSYVGSTIRGEFLLKTSKENRIDIAGYKIEDNKIAMNVVIINPFDAKNIEKDKTFCDTEIDVTISLTVCGESLEKTGKRSLTYISSAAYSLEQIGKDYAEKYGCVVADLSFKEVYSRENEVIAYFVSGLTNKDTATVAVIPSTYNGKPVTSIYEFAFNGCTSLISVKMPDKITSIDDLAFSGCTSLTSVIFPNSLTSIGYAAFSGCTSLTNITLPNSLTFIDGGAFNDCTSLTNITIPNGVTSIGMDTFNGCTNLTSVTFPNRLTSVGNRAFSDCTSLTNITLPDSVTTIGARAFVNCTSLTNITIGNGVTSIESDTFNGCTSLTSVTFPNSLTSIDVTAFKDCKSLTNITLPNTVTSIGNMAFHDCYRLKKVYYKGSVEEWNKIPSTSQIFYYATIYYYSETEPTTEGNYWHYVDGVATPWGN